MNKAEEAAEIIQTQLKNHGISSQIRKENPPTGAWAKSQCTLIIHNIKNRGTMMEWIPIPIKETSNGEVTVQQGSNLLNAYTWIATMFPIPRRKRSILNYPQPAT